MTGQEMYNIIKKNVGMGGSKPRAYCGMSGGAWCNAYVCYAFNQAGLKSLYYGGKKVTYCPTSIKWCSANLAQIPPYLAMPCDIIYFDWQPNGRPDHIGFVKAKRTTDSVFTHEGNTSGGKVAEKTRPAKYIEGIFRPHFTAKGLKKEKLAVDGDFGYKSIYNLQVALGIKADGILGKATVKALQKKVGASADGAWGKGTSKAIQTKLAKAGYYTGKIDGEFGKQSVTGLQKYINAKLYVSNTPTTTTKPATTATKTATTSTLKSYRIEVDLTNQICTVYGVYSNGSSKVLMSEFVSTAKKGKTTPVGNFKIQSGNGKKAKYRTAKMSSGKSYAEYLCRFHGAKCMHTVPYSKRNTKGYVSKTEFNKLGTPASSGCVRMPYKLAKYIYEKCPVGTPVKVFKGTKGKYPAGKPKKYTATKNVDPTK